MDVCPLQTTASGLTLNTLAWRWPQKCEPAVHHDSIRRGLLGGGVWGLKAQSLHREALLIALPVVAG